MSSMQVGSKVEELLDQDEQKELADKYGIQLIDKIDEGSFGIVFKGIDLSDGSLIAVKVTQQNKEKYSSIETSILSGLDHPNIVKFKKFIEAHSNKYIVMEYIGCGNLYQLIEERRLAKKPFSEQEISEIMLYLLLAVKCMHENNVIHRDIKPENILLGSKEDFSQLKVSDFGLSVKYQDGAPFRSYSQRCGTVMFMAPEILLEKQYSKPIDIWSCGIILYMLFTMGRHPFKNSAETREEYVKRLSSLNTSIKTPSIEQAFAKTPLASDLFLRMVAKEPLNRYTVGQVLKHPFITRKLNANIPLSFQENTRVFINQRKLAETMKALMMLNFIRDKVSRSHESNYKLTKILRPPSLSARIFPFNDNNSNEELAIHRESSSAVGSPRITDRTQLRSQKRLFREESPDTIKETDYIEERVQGQQQQQISTNIQFSQKNKLSVIDIGNNSPSAMRVMSSRMPPTPNQDHKSNQKYTNNPPSISQHNGTTTTNSAQSSRRISKFQSLSPTGNTLLSLPSISKINTQQNQRQQQQQQQQPQQQFFPEPYTQSQQQQQQQFSQISRNSPVPQQPSSNPPVKVLSSHGSRAHRLSQQSQQQQQSLATQTSTISSSTQIKAASLQRPLNTVPTTPYQSSKTNVNGTRKATFQIKLLNSPLGSLSGTPTNSSGNIINTTGSNNQNANNNNNNNNNTGGQQQQILDNMFKAIKTPGIKGQQIQQTQQQQQLQLNSVLNASKHCLTSNSNTNSPSNMNSGNNTNYKLNGLLSIATQHTLNHGVNHSNNDNTNTPSPISVPQFINNTTTNSQKSLRSNNITPNSPNHKNNKSIDNLNTANNGIGKINSPMEQGSSQIAKSSSQSNLQDMRGTKSKEAYKRSHFSNINFKEFEGQYQGSHQSIPTQGSSSNAISIQKQTLPTSSGSVSQQKYQSSQQLTDRKQVIKGNQSVSERNNNSFDLQCQEEI